MKYVCLFLLTGFTALAESGQAPTQDDQEVVIITGDAPIGHLIPLSDVADLVKDTITSEYQRELFHRLFQDQPRADAFLLEVASFQKERLLLLYHSDDGFFLCMRKPAGQIWDYRGTSSKASHTIITVTAPINEPLARRIIDIWHRELHRTKWPETAPRLILDGSQYIFGGRFSHRAEKYSWEHEMIGETEDFPEDSSISEEVRLSTLLLLYLEFPEPFRRSTSPEQRTAILKKAWKQDSDSDWVRHFTRQSEETQSSMLLNPWAVLEMQTLRAEHKQANQPPLQTPASGMPAASASAKATADRGAPVAPPSGAAGR